MKLETWIACGLFPRDQAFMARRKLRVALAVVLVGVLASGLFVGMIYLAQSQK